MTLSVQDHTYFKSLVSLESYASLDMYKGDEAQGYKKENKT